MSRGRKVLLNFVELSDSDSRITMSAASHQFDIQGISTPISLGEIRHVAESPLGLLLGTSRRCNKY